MTQTRDIINTKMQWGKYKAEGAHGWDYLIHGNNG